MQTTQKTWRSAVLAALMLVGSVPAARAAAPSDGDTTAKPRDTTAAEAAPGSVGATPPATPAPIEEQLRRQGEMLEQMQQLLLKQQAEIDRLRGELDTIHGDGTAAAAAPAVATSGAATTGSATPVAATSTAPQDTADLGKRIEAVEKRFGGFAFSGDLRARSESLFNQGFDTPLDIDSRYRARLRLRFQITDKIDNHFDLGLRLASGSFDDPTSTNQTLTSFFDR